MLDTFPETENTFDAKAWIVEKKTFLLRKLDNFSKCKVKVSTHGDQPIVLWKRDIYGKIRSSGSDIELISGLPKVSNFRLEGNSWMGSFWCDEVCHVAESVITGEFSTNKEVFIEDLFDCCLMFRVPEKIKPYWKKLSCMYILHHYVIFTYCTSWHQTFPRMSLVSMLALGVSLITFRESLVKLYSLIKLWFL